MHACVDACVHSWYFTCLEAHELVWLSGRPHLNLTEADNVDPLMRLFCQRALSLTWVEHFYPSN